jgi:hypothetical protein
MREQGKAQASEQQAEQSRESPEEAYGRALPPELVSVIGQAAPEIVGMLLQNHPQMSMPLMAAINQLRGHGFAQQALAAATRAPLHKPVPEADGTPASHPAQQPASPPPPPPAHAEPKVPPEVRKMRAVAGGINSRPPSRTRT